MCEPATPKYPASYAILENNQSIPNTISLTYSFKAGVTYTVNLRIKEFDENGSSWFGEKCNKVPVTCAPVTFTAT